jgi:uncharacterized protein (DUF362 family)
LSASPRRPRVAVVHRPGLAYHPYAPFDPPQPVYEAAEALFRSLGLDRARAGTPEWNPLGDLIAPGDRVIVKPNLVSSKNLHEKIEGDKLAASSTHGSLLRPILDYALRAAGPRGQVAVVDSPVEGCEIEKVIEPLGVAPLVRDLQRRHNNLSFIDLRTFRVAPRLWLDDARRLGRSWNLGLLLRTKLPGDPRGYRTVEIGDRSFFCGWHVPANRLRFHRSHPDTPVPHHQDGHHEYSIPGTVLAADVVINVPKMKTHKKTGVTLSLKSVIGLTNEKYWLPHFTAGDPSKGGDEYDRPQRIGERVGHRLSRLPLPGDNSLIARAPRVGDGAAVRDGGWQGNDTLWRTILDLNQALLFADRDGVLRPEPQRRYLTIVDGILGGEGEGPLGATPAPAGLLVGGFDPISVDYAASRAMGYAPELIPQVARAIGSPQFQALDFAAADLDRVLDGPEPAYLFRPPRSWSRLLPRA